MWRSGPGNAVANSFALAYLGQWSMRSLWTTEGDFLAVGTDFITLRWDSVVGPPNRGGSATAPTATHFGASGSVSDAVAVSGSWAAASAITQVKS